MRAKCFHQHCKGTVSPPFLSCKIKDISRRNVSRKQDESLIKEPASLHNFFLWNKNFRSGAQPCQELILQKPSGLWSIVRPISVSFTLPCWSWLILAGKVCHSVSRTTEHSGEQVNSIKHPNRFLHQFVIKKE